MGASGNGLTILGVLNTVESKPSTQGYKMGKHDLTASAVAEMEFHRISNVGLIRFECGF